MTKKIHTVVTRFGFVSAPMDLFSAYRYARTLRQLGNEEVMVRKSL